MRVGATKLRLVQPGRSDRGQDLLPAPPGSLTRAHPRPHEEKEKEKEEKIGNGGDQKRDQIEDQNLNGARSISDNLFDVCVDVNRNSIPWPLTSVVLA